MIEGGGIAIEGHIPLRNQFSIITDLVITIGVYCKYFVRAVKGEELPIGRAAAGESPVVVNVKVTGARFAVCTQRPGGRLLKRRIILVAVVDISAVPVVLYQALNILIGGSVIIWNVWVKEIIKGLCEFIL